MSSEIVKIDCQIREKTGKGVARSLRREGKFPAIIYGGKKDEIKISTDLKEFNKEYFKGNLSSKIVELDLGSEKIKALPRDIQIHPVTDRVIHVDFQRVSENEKIRVAVGVVLKNAEKSPGLKRGGVLNIVRRKIEFICDISNVPSSISVDLDGKQIGDTIHFSDIEVPEGVVPTIDDRDFTIVTIVGKGAKQEEDSEETSEEESEESED